MEFIIISKSKCDMWMKYNKQQLHLLKKLLLFQPVALLFNITVL